MFPNSFGSWLETLSRDLSLQDLFWNHSFWSDFFFACLSSFSNEIFFDNYKVGFKIT
jgi:hypothetical protein